MTKIGETKRYTKDSKIFDDTIRNKKECFKQPKNSLKNSVKKGVLLNAKDGQNTSNPLCLLYRSQTPRFYLNESTYINGEKTVVLGAYPTQTDSKSNLGREKGQKLIQWGISRKQASKIRRCVRMLFFEQPDQLKFLTLTFDRIPPDLEAKKILDRFLERLRRYLGKNFHYVWVAEKQKRGAIHYHLILIDFIPIEVIRKKWEAVVHKWEKTQDYTAKRTLQINIKAIQDNNGIDTYLTKTFKKVGGYLTKDEKKGDIQPIEGNIWNCSSITRELLKAEKLQVTADNYELLYDRYCDIANDHLNKQIFEHKIKDKNVSILFIPSGG